MGDYTQKTQAEWDNDRKAAKAKALKTQKAEALKAQKAKLEALQAEIDGPKKTEAKTETKTDTKPAGEK